MYLVFINQLPLVTLLYPNSHLQRNEPRVQFPFTFVRV